MMIGRNKNDCFSKEFLDQVVFWLHGKGKKDSHLQSVIGSDESVSVVSESASKSKSYWST